MNGIPQKTENLHQICLVIHLPRKFGGYALKAMNIKPKFLIDPVEQAALFAVEKKFYKAIMIYYHNFRYYQKSGITRKTMVFALK